MTHTSPYASRHGARRAARFLLLAALTLAAGCGLSDYGKLMEAEQKRVQNLDEQAKLLGDPAELSIKGVDLFLRLPKGIVSRGEPFAETLFRFARQPGYGSRYYSNSGDDQAQPFQEVYVGAVVGGEMKDFLQKVLQAFGASGGTPGKKVVTPPGKNPLQFEWINFEDAASAYQSFFITMPDIKPVQVVIVFRMPKDQAQAAGITKTIDACLPTLTVGPGAEIERQRYVPTKPKK